MEYFRDSGVSRNAPPAPAALKLCSLAPSQTYFLSTRPVIEPGPFEKEEIDMMTPRPAAIAALLALSVFQPASPVHAVPGDLDVSFAGFGNNNGTYFWFGGSSAMAVAPDGKLVTAGHSGVQLVLRRFLPDGTPDPTFDGDGMANLLNTAYSMRADDVAVQPDGKIVVAGWNEYGNFLLARALPSGGVDVSFGANGYVTTDFDGQSDVAHAVVIQPDGKIVAAGTSRVGGDNDFSVARYHPNGALDTSFSGDGKLTIGFGGDDGCHDAALQPDGKIVLVGEYWDDWDIDQDYAVARLNPDGTFDSTFDLDGKASYGLSDDDTAHAVAVRDDGYIVVAGVSDYGQTGTMVRLSPNGYLDATFDGDGRLSVSGSDGLWDVAVLPDRRMVLAGWQITPEGNRVAFHRLLLNGSPDPSFSGDGVATLQVGNQPGYGRSLALLPDGRIIGHGVGEYGASMLLRLWQDGGEDTGGHQALGFPESFMGPGSLESVSGLAVQQDGKIVVAGEIINAAATERDFGVARFLPDGEIDRSFGTGGMASLDFHNTDVAGAVALQPDGKIVVAGNTGSGDINFLVARFNPDGSLDSQFGFFGYNVIDFMGGPDYAHAVTIAPDGKIVVAGTVFNGARYVFGVCRFTADGVADYSFDLDARQLHELSFGATHWASSVVVQDDLKIVLGGHVGYDFAIVRYNENGSVDFGFGPWGTGYNIVDMGGVDFAGAMTMAVGGWFYLGGGRTLNGNTDFAVAQFMPDGILASCSGFPCFNWSTGRAYWDFGGYDAVYSIDWRNDGQVLAAGSANGQIGWAQFSTRSPSAPWTGMTDFVGVGEAAVGAKFVGSDRIVVATTQSFNGDLNFGLAKFYTSSHPYSVGVEDTEASAPPSPLRLHPAAPNPFFARTVLTFEVDDPQPVRIALYDASGRLVRMIAEGPFEAGRHEHAWDGTDERGRRVPAGVYFVRADAAKGRATEKLVVLR